ncbi:kinase-like domain-containing protein, partial [Mycena alexandri]
MCSVSVSACPAKCAIENSLSLPKPTPPTPSKDDFDVLLSIGHGASSSVFLVREKATQKLYSLKQSPRQGQSSDVEQEQHILQAVASLPNAPRSLLSLAASWTDSEFFYLLTPWCEGKDLSSLLVSDHCFTADRVKQYMIQLVLALDALHGLNVVHRDIKPANVFLTQDGNIVLGDFGFAKLFNTSLTNGHHAPIEVSFDDDVSCTTRERCGTLHWMSPAQHAGTPYSFDADMWGLGMLMFKMLSSKLPFGEDANTPAELRAAYANDPIDFRAEYEIGAEAQDLIRGLLAKEAKDRMTLDQMKAHPYFSGM